MCVWLEPIPTQPTHTLVDTPLGWSLYQPNQHTNSSTRYLVGPYTNPTNTQTPRYATWLDCIPNQPTHKLFDTLLCQASIVSTLPWLLTIISGDH